MPLTPIYGGPEGLQGEEIVEDRELLKATAEGNHLAFSALFEAKYSNLYTFAFKLTRSKVLAEEIIQDVFLNIWLNRASLETIVNFDAYINRITRNLSFNALRNIAKDKVLNSLEADENFPDHSTEQSLAYKDTLQLMQDAIAKLPPQQQAVYKLCHKEGLTYEQAAVRLGIASSTVHSHMKAALGGLRKHLKKMGIPIVVMTILIP